MRRLLRPAPEGRRMPARGGDRARSGRGYPRLAYASLAAVVAGSSLVASAAASSQGPPAQDDPAQLSGSAYPDTSAAHRAADVASVAPREALVASASRLDLGAGGTA